MGAFGCIWHALVRDEGSTQDYLPSIVLLGFLKENILLILSNYARLCLEFIYKKTTFFQVFFFFFFFAERQRGAQFKKKCRKIEKRAKNFQRRHAPRTNTQRTPPPMTKGGSIKKKKKKKTEKLVFSKKWNLTCWYGRKWRNWILWGSVWFAWANQRRSVDQFVAILYVF